MTQQGTAALAQLAIISSDGYLSEGEKPQVILDYQAIVNEEPIYVAQAATLGVSSTTYVAAYNALTAYLNSLSPAWNDKTHDTAIVAATFQGKWADYYTARASLSNAIAQASAQSIPAVNKVKFSLFEKGATGWAILSNPSSLATPINGVGILNGINYYQTQGTSTAAGQSIIIGNDTGYNFAVNAGDRMCFQSGIQVGGPHLRHPLISEMT